jgi:type I restriction enzyme, S subunit
VTLRVHPDEIVANSISGMLATHSTWERVRLDQVASVLNGCAFPSTGFGKSGDMPLIRIRDVGRASTGTWYTGEFEPQYVVENGSLIVGMDGEFRVDTWRGPPALLNQRVCKIEVRNLNLYSERFLRWVLPGYLDAVNHATSSVTVKHLSSRTIKELPLPLPPIAEQKRIVAAIDEQFSRLDAGVAGLERVQRNLKRMRAAVLEAAIRGRLDEAQRGSGSFIETEQCSLPPEWKLVDLGDIAEISGGITKSPKRRPQANPAPFLRVANVQRDRLELADIHEIEVFEGELSRFRLQRGDLLIVEGNGSPDQIGRGALWDGSIDPCVHQNHLIRVRSSAKVLPAYLNLFWNAPSSIATIRAVASSTSGLYTLSTGKVRSIPVVLPPIEVQRRIVGEVERQLSFTDALSGGLVRTTSLSRSLRAGILSAAFSGELVPQNANDEPASRLLERIGAERAASNGHKPAKITGRRRRKAAA